jgi:hypothetical protein
MAVAIPRHIKSSADEHKGCQGSRRASAFSPTGHRGTATTAIAAAGKGSWRRLAYLILLCPKRTGQFNPSQICGRLHCRACVLAQCGVRRLKMGVRERRPGVRRRGDGTPLIQVERLVYRCNREFVRQKFCWFKTVPLCLRLFACRRCSHQNISSVGACGGAKNSQRAVAFLPCL